MCDHGFSDLDEVSKEIGIGHGFSGHGLVLIGIDKGEYDQWFSGHGLFCSKEFGCCRTITVFLDLDLDWLTVIGNWTDARFFWTWTGFTGIENKIYGSRFSYWTRLSKELDDLSVSLDM